MKTLSMLQDGEKKPFCSQECDIKSEWLEPRGIPHTFPWQQQINRKNPGNIQGSRGALPGIIM
jgi:hypothetical protein